MVVESFPVAWYLDLVSPGVKAMSPRNSGQGADPPLGMRKKLGFAKFSAGACKDAFP
jgi:hypothetical protein